MPKCYNCGVDQLGSLVRNSSCAVPRCLNQVCIVEGSTDNFYCPFHQQEFPTKIKNLESKVAELERKSPGRGSISTPPQEIQELRTENQNLTTALSLKVTEIKELQAEIRASHTKLSELENQLELVKKKLAA